ncbi:MAG: hypothetical protein AAFX99_29180 [Myxococcota bacterium]
MDELDGFSFTEKHRRSETISGRQNVPTAWAIAAPEWDFEGVL